MGVFGLLMLLMLFWGINYIKGTDILSSTRTYYALFDKIDGIKPNTDVQVRGVKIGSVISAEYNPEKSDKIIVTFNAKSKYKIPDDSRITIYNKMLITGTVLELKYGTSTDYFVHRDTIPSDAGVDFVNLVTSEVELLKNRALDLIANMNRTLDGVNAILSEENARSISGTLENLNKIVSVDVANMTGNLSELSASLNANSRKIDNIVSNVENLTDTLNRVDITGLVANVNATVDELNSAIVKINSGSGSAGMLLNDSALYDSLVAASGNLALLLEDIKANPKKYVRSSVFGGKN